MTGGIGWRPIDTAPKDGSDIIVGCDVASVWVIHVAFWREVDENLIAIGWEAPGDTGWWSYTRNSVTQEKLEGWATPTHWMPLPTPPNRDLKGTKDADQ